MSSWTHITACLSIETGIIDKKPALKRKLKEIFREAPKITGSESNADIFINIQGGYSWYMSRDCEHCKWRETIKEFQDENGDDVFECDAPKDHDCSAKYQTRIVVSIQGDLRDRMYDQTKEEFNAFMEFIENHPFLSIRDYAVNIVRDC